MLGKGENLQESAKISENLRLGSVRPLKSALTGSSLEDSRTSPPEVGLFFWEA